jgi:ABC-2 type transport system ATP-binding protein
MSLRLAGVSIRYGDQQVLDGVSLHVRKGDCYGFLGHNGAGKTTAMRIALGLVPPDAGQVLVEGFDAARHPLEARARMGALLEVPGFHASLSGKRNLVLLARLQGIAGRAADAEADRVLEAVGLTHAASKRAGAYSQGMRQRLGIAQALLGRPRVVLLDEPTNGLDPEGIEEIRRLLRRLTREEGATVLLSSHQLHEIEGVCNRVGIIRQGKMLVEEETARLRAVHADRHLLRTGDDAAATRVLASLGLAPRAEDGTLEVSLGARTAGEVAKAVVSAGIELRSFGPRATTLEEIYLRFTHDGAARAAPAGEAPPASSPAERIAAPGPVRRVAAYDVRRWAASAALPLALAAPAAVAALAIVSEKVAASGDAAALAGGKVATTAHFTAFTAAARGLASGLPLLALTVAAAAAHSVAGEFGRGTLRNVALRPVGRARMIAGKTLASAGAAALGYLLLVGATLGVAGALFAFEDLVEILPGGQRFLYEGFAASDLWPVLERTALVQAPAVLSFAAVGVLLGSLAKGGAGAVVGVFATTLALVGAPAILGRAAAGWLPSGHLPWLVTDASPVRRLYDLSTGVSNAAAEDPRALWVPLAWGVVATALACLRMRRRAIP